MPSALNGLLLLDKPAGWTSHDVVQKVRKLLGTKRVGHAGTLDPMATGLLVVAVGRATRILQYLTLATKRYQGRIACGITTDTLDSTGQIQQQRRLPPLTASQVAHLMQRFTGAIMQLPPMYSAVKVKGRSLHRYARAGTEVRRQPRWVYVERFDVTNWQPPYLDFSVTCSKGTYVRVLAEDVGELLGCGACLYSLQRTQSGSFYLHQAQTLDQLQQAVADPQGPQLLSLAEALPDWQRVEVSADMARGLRHGRRPSPARLLTSLPKETTQLLLLYQQRVVALAEIQPQAGYPLKLLRVFPEEVDSLLEG